MIAIRVVGVSLVAAVGLSSCSRCGGERQPEAPIAGGASTTPRTLSLDEVSTYLYGPGPSATFEATTASEHAMVAAVIPKLLDAARAAALPDLATLRTQAAAHGFAIERWQVGGEHYLALVEARDRPRGGGAYIIRVAPAESGPVLLLQAPHAYFDVGTGDLAAELFFQPPPGPRPRALFTNTIHRYQRGPGDKQKRKHNPADVAHNADHAFNVATEAFAIAARHIRLVQLHGFGNLERASVDDDEVVSDTAMVVSAGDSAGSSPWSSRVASELRAIFGDGVVRFPEDVRKLGATTNVQNRTLRTLGGHHFLHVEMSRVVRDRLAASRDLRERLATALFAPVGSP
jgi:hypothetical protein